MKNGAVVDKRNSAYIGSKLWKDRDLTITGGKTSVTVIDKTTNITLTQWQVKPEDRQKVKRWLTAELAARVRGFITHDLPKPEEADDAGS